MNDLKKVKVFDIRDYGEEMPKRVERVINMDSKEQEVFGAEKPTWTPTSMSIPQD